MWMNPIVTAPKRANLKLIEWGVTIHIYCFSSKSLDKQPSHYIYQGFSRLTTTTHKLVGHADFICVAATFFRKPTRRCEKQFGLSSGVSCTQWAPPSPSPHAPVAVGQDRFWHLGWCCHSRWGMWTECLLPTVVNPRGFLCVSFHLRNRAKCVPLD